MVAAVVLRQWRAGRRGCASAPWDPPREPGERRPCRDGRTGLCVADAIGVEGRYRGRAAVHAVPRPDLVARMGLLAGVPAGAADGAQGEAVSRVATGRN